MKITFLAPQSELTAEQQNQLSKLGQTTYIDSYRAYPLPELIKLTHGSTYLGFEPDIIGGFEVAKERLVQLAQTLPKLKGIALSTRATEYIDQTYFSVRGISITNAPGCTTESIAEHSLTLALGCAKRIFLLDRRSQKGEYRLEKGIELAGKTLGIVGLGHIGSRMAKLGQGLGMQVIAWNRSKKTISGVAMESLDYVLSHSDVISLHLASNDETKNILSSNMLHQLKKGVIIVNTANRSLVDELAMARALESGLVDSYACEAEDLVHTPLSHCENAFLFQGFGWYTKEALARNKEIWVNNLVSLVKGKPSNRVI